MVGTCSASPTRADAAHRASRSGLPCESSCGALVLQRCRHAHTHTHTHTSCAQILSGSGRIREGGLFHPQDEASKMSKG